jgi:hypothetical protein
MITSRVVVCSGKALGVIILLVVVVLGGWWALYPGPDEPKGMLYIGWRLGLPTMDQDRALGTMVGDVHREGLVIGKSKDELRARFGYVTTLDEPSSEYVRFCYNNYDTYRGKDVLILRRSNWMVVMKDGRAEDLVLVKGC